MPCDEIDRDLPVTAEREKVGDPFLAAGTAADRGAADLHAGEHFLHGKHCRTVELKIFLFVRVLPEPGEVRFIPDLAGPERHFLFTVTMYEMPQCRFDQCGPFIHVPGRCRMRVPVEDGVRTVRQGSGHEAELEEGPEPGFAPGVDRTVKIGEAIFRMPVPLSILMHLADPHLVAEQAVAADVPEMARVLNGAKLLLVFLLHRKVHPARADTEVRQIAELRL